MHVSTKCSIAIHCLIVISESGPDMKVTSTLLSKSSGCNAAMIRNIMSALRKDGIVDIRNTSEGTVLADSPENISLYRICMAVEPDLYGKLIGVHNEPSQICPVGRNIEEILDNTYAPVKDALIESMKKVTLADAIANYRRAMASEQ